MSKCTIDGRPVHATNKLAPVYEVAVSQHTNEKSANFTDNARTKLIAIVIEGTNSQLPDEAGTKPTPGFDDPQGMHDFLSGLQQSPRPVKVVTPLETLEQATLESYAPVKDGSHSLSLHYTVKFVEYRTVDLQVTNVKTRQGAQTKRGPAANVAPPPPARGALEAGADAVAGPGFLGGSTARQPVANPAAGAGK